MPGGRVWLLICLMAGLLACGGDGTAGRRSSAETATLTPAPPTPSPTATPAATFTVPPPSHTISPTATLVATFTVAPTSTATPTPVPEGAVALFSMDALSPDNPFPSDRLLDATGHVRVTGNVIGADLPPEPLFDTARTLSDVVAGQLTALTGFSTFAPIRVKFDRPVVVPEDGGPEDILLLAHDDLSVAAPITAGAVTPDISGDYAIEIQPVVPLRPKTRYVYVVTRALRDANDDPVRASADLAAALHGGAGGGSAAWRAALDPVLAHLREQRGIDVDDIAVIDFFTTQPTTDDLIAIRDLFANGTLPTAQPVFENSPVPRLRTGIFPEGTPEFADLIGSPTSETVAAVAVGSFPSFDFRTGPNGAFDPARVAGRVTPSVNHLDFYLTIPKAPPPPGGYPITIFGHGLGGSGREAVTISRVVGTAPMMGIGISAVEHGRRGNVVNFFVLTNGLITRERFRQTIADFLQLTRMIRQATVPPFDQVDKARIHYLGVSLGGIMGTLFMGVEPDVGAAVLSVPGGGLPNILESPAIGSLLKPLIALTVSIPLDHPLFPVFLHRFKHLSQWFLDPADPINTAPFVIDPQRRLPGVSPKRILMHEGIIDTVVPNPTTDALALAMGLPDVKATRGCAVPAGCSGIWRFVMTEYGQDEFSGHSVTGFLPQATAQAAEFLVSDGRVILDASP